MAGNGEIRIEMTQVDLEKHGVDANTLKQMRHNQIMEICDAMQWDCQNAIEDGCNEDECIAIIETTWVMVQCIKDKQELLEKWLIQHLLWEAECRQDSMDDYMRNVIKTIDERRTWLVEIEL